MDRAYGMCHHILDTTRVRIGARDQKSPPHSRALRRCSLRPARRTTIKRDYLSYLPSNRCRLKLREGKWPRPTSPNSEIDNRRDR